MTLSTLPAAPEPTFTGPGTAACAEPVTVPDWWRRSTDLNKQAISRATRPDYEAWLTHVKTASACTRPVRLAGSIATIDTATGRILSERHTADLPDGVIYKPCGNRRESVCPACSDRYKRDAYHVVRSGLVGGKGVTEQVARHPAVFPTFTAPSFGQVHTRVVHRHTCTRRTDCDCRPEPCHARRDLTTCPHGVRLVCFARHAETDHNLGTPLCRDCYDYDAQAVWNVTAGELWRRTSIAINRYIRRVAKQRGVTDVPVTTYDKNGKARTRWVCPLRLSFGKAAEMQRRGVVHFHAIVRLDGYHPDDPDAITAPPPELDAADLVAAVDHAASTVSFTTDPHPANREGWPISWGAQVLTKVITVAADGQVTDAQVAAYLAKYATKSTEITGHASNRLTDDTVTLYADPDGTHTERLIDACWRLGNFRANPEPPAPLAAKRRAEPAPADPFGPLRTDPDCGGCTRYRICPTCAAEQVATEDAARRTPPGPPASPYFRLRRWAHMLGFGGHFLTKSRRYSITFAMLRDQRVTFRRAQTGGPEQAEPAVEPTTLVVNFLQFVGAGWQTPADAMLANTSAAMAREHAESAREALQTLAA
ncbi:replication initiator [Actinoplanes sp. NPDC026619]|uniref:replication initiator n=1 Tax=Actinoplanes sp. NPDC026619 TaxID=3155798 RepID=UPI0033FDA688